MTEFEKAVILQLETINQKLEIIADRKRATKCCSENQIEDYRVFATLGACDIDELVSIIRRRL